MIGILGGTFDPIHKGHIEIARSIQNSFRLSELYLLPSFIPPHRSQPGASATERLAMLDLAI
ncbi:MAG TPA: adenylyltransferase/cytidyltransferase family protein, partial [Coxiellaceae bacterium]|nr:adenylyltransferase/cytidyltransferase family protein [Coxiellaceae bacterium]